MAVVVSCSFDGILLAPRLDASRGGNPQALESANAYNLHMGSLDRWAALRDDIDRVRLDFIRTDLQVCLTLASLADTEYDLGNREHAARTVATVEKGYSTLLRFFSQAKCITPEARAELHFTFQRLRNRIGRLQGRG
jgi:non-ribosomal peptide synthetase component F